MNLNFIKKSFANRLYTRANISQQKIFKFSYSPQIIKQSDNQIEDEIKLTKEVNELETKLKNIHSFISINNMNNNFEIKENKNNEKDLIKIQSSLNSKKSSLKKINNKINPEKEQIIRKSLYLDVLSDKLEFQNIYLNNLNFLRFFSDRDTREDRLLLEEVGKMEESMENEIIHYVNNLIKEEVVQKNINDIDHYDGILIDSDNQIQFNASAEVERLFETLNPDDDFTMTFSEEKQIKKKVKRETTNDAKLTEIQTETVNADDSFVNIISSKINK